MLTCAVWIAASPPGKEGDDDEAVVVLWLFSSSWRLLDDMDGILRIDGACAYYR